MVDTRGYAKIQKMALETKKEVESENWSRATDLWGQTEMVILSETGGIDFYNILTKQMRYSHKDTSA